MNKSLEISRKLIENELLDRDLYIEDLVLVWYCHTLGNVKSIWAYPDAQLMFEVTYDSIRHRWYTDVYEKVSNSVFPRDKDRPTSLNVYTGFEQ